MRIAALRETSRSLRAPPSARLRFLEELRADLEDLESSLRATGLSEAEARRRAQAMLAPDADTLAALSRVHRPLWERWQARVPGRRARVVAFALGLVALVAVIAAVRDTASVRDLPLFLVPIAGIAIAAVLRIASKVVRIWLAGESESKRVLAGSGDLLIAAGGALVATAFGVVFELYHTASLIVVGPALQSELLMLALRRVILLGIAGIAVAMPCGLAWLFFVRQAAGLERRERALLGPDLDVATAPFNPSTRRFS